MLRCLPEPPPGTTPTRESGRHYRSHDRGPAAPSCRGAEDFTGNRDRIQPGRCHDVKSQREYRPQACASPLIVRCANIDAAAGSMDANVAPKPLGFAAGTR